MTWRIDEAGVTSRLRINSLPIPGLPKKGRLQT